MDFMLVCLSVSLGIACAHTHKNSFRVTQTTHTRGWAENVDMYVAPEVMMRDRSWHV